MFDLNKAKDKNSQRHDCPKCEAADAVLAAYRHALKDVARCDNGQEKRIAMLALDTDAYHRLGKLFHLIVKAAFQYVAQGNEFAFKALVDSIHELEKHPEATVRGWRGGKV